MFLLPESEVSVFTYRVAPEMKDAFCNEWKEQSSRFVLMPKIEAIHAKKVTKNFTYYTKEGFMDEILHPKHGIPSGINSWLIPFPKPVLKNHDSESEPLGRIASARVVQTGRKIYEELVPVITDSDAIEKILDGRYLTTSISSETDSITCSICKQNLLESKDTFWRHEHERGETYDDKLAYWIMGHLWHSEISFVNKPSDSDSKVIQANTKESAKEKDYKLEMFGCYKDKIFDMETGDEYKVGEVFDESEAGTFYSIVDSNKEEVRMPEPKDEKKVELETLRSEIGKLTSEKETISQEKAAIEAKVADLEEKVQTTETELNTANEQLKEVEKRNAEVLSSLHMANVERLVDLKVFLGKASDRDAEIKKYSEKSPESVSDLIEELKGEIGAEKASTSEAKDSSASQASEIKDPEDEKSKKIDVLMKLFNGTGRNKMKKGNK